MSSKWSSFKKQQMIMENWRKYTEGELLTEKKIPGFDPKQFPNPLPGDVSKDYMAKGWDDSPDDEQTDQNKADDIVQVEMDSGNSAQELMPSQNAVFLGKALGMSMVPKLSSGGNIGAVISEDNHILDGHHRWAATMLANPTAQILGTQIMLPIQQLIPVLRAAGDAYGNPRKGEPKGGDVNVFSKEAALPETVQAMIETGKYMNPEFYNKEKLAAHVEKIGGIEAVVEAVQKMQAQGAKAYNGSGVDNAPPRKQMPVLEPKQGNVKNVANRLQKGTIDVAPPYAGAKKGKASLGGESLPSRKQTMAQTVSETKK
tara:strand:+ start:95 stop:1039 length:945 start_codon:yes stop_codon:yes gene_type:complete